MGLLLPDPCDRNCPEDFKLSARELLPKLVGSIGKSDKDLRTKLLRFAAEFSNWDQSSHPTFLEVARGLVKAANGEESPMVVDPFAGGGSIPLEALRVGCDTFASDLNPVATLILKVLLEDIPRHGNMLAENLKRAAADVKVEAEKELAQFYPTDPDGSRPLAYLWARTVTCETPGCGAEIPLLRSFWLSKKASRKRALRHKIIRQKGKVPKVEFEIFEPKEDADVLDGTVTRGNAKCLCCATVLPVARVRAQLVPRLGGADDARLLAVVTLNENTKGRHYRPPTAQDHEAVKKSQQKAKELANEKLDNGLSLIPDEPTPLGGGSGAGRAFSVRKYGMNTWSDLFTARQKVVLATITKKVSYLRSDPGIVELLSFVTSRLADRLCSLVGWDTGGEKMGHVFNRQALPMVWDFAEGVPFSDATGSYKNIIKQILGVVTSSENLQLRAGQASMADACNSPLPDGSCNLWFTDPPYYDAVPYANLSDFFYVWLRRALPHSPLFKGMLTPKEQEIIQDEVQEVNAGVKDRDFFERQMSKAFREGRRILTDDGIGCVVFAHKTTEGWEALLSGMLSAGWTITASWPISTERPSRLRAQESAALSASIHLVCRPRPVDAGTGDWGQVYAEMKEKVANWMDRLAEESIRGADLVFACIGPALEVYSRYVKVVDANDREIPLGGDPLATEPYQRGYLAYIWEVVGRTALEQILGTAEAKARNGAAGVLEEDARLTALFLWTLKTSPVDATKIEESDDDEEESYEELETSPTKGKQKQGYSLIYDVARRFAQPLGIDLEKWTGRIIENKKGVVRLLSVKERAEQLFGNERLSEIASRFESKKAQDIQTFLFPEEESAQIPNIRGRKLTGKTTSNIVERTPVTTLDRVHAAMLLQASGQAGALKALIESEQERSSDFVRLANALSALYPEKSEEKRLLDAMLLGVPRR